jgi:serine/threonine-protein kinase
MDTTHFDPASPAPRSPSDPLHELRSLGEYRILRRIGEGGMGAVYLGYHEGQSQQVAIKVLADHLASNQSYVDRFYREARSGALLNHPNIVRFLSVGQDRATGKHYLVMEFVDGPSALALLERQGKLSVGDAVHIALDVARGLEHAHSRNVVHRDIKPDNILITRSGVCKLTDLGLAKRIDEPSHLTAARQGFGTPHYMPYEQAVNARSADGRSDVYALGATLYHLVAGVVPFPGENHLEVVEKKHQGDFTPAGKLNPAVPPVLDFVLSRMLAFDPRDRYQTASELIIDLERTRLAAPVPSFADPDLALKDPWVRAWLVSSAEPTRPDLDSAPRPAPAPTEVGVWYLRFRKADGSVGRAKATTTEIVQRLREGRMPAAVEACRQLADGFKPLREFKEFATIPSPRKRRIKVTRINAKPKADGVASAPQKEDAPQRPRRKPWLWIGVGTAVILVITGVVTLVKLLMEP